MDNFMDKLAKRFNAGELIKANSAAEEKELARAKERSEEYEKMMQEMRRLNLKNVEVTEQVQQLIKSGIEGFEEYDKSGPAMNEFLTKTEEKFDKVEELIQSVQAENKKYAETSETFKGGIDEILKTLQDAEEKSDAVEVDFAPVYEKVNELILKNNEKIKVMLSFNNEKMQEILERNSEIEQGLLAENDQKTEASVLRLMESVEANQLQIKELQKNIEDYVHKENVKVYRNVQAVVTDQVTGKARELGDRFDKVEKATKGIGTLKAVTVLTLLVVIGMLVLEVGKMFQLF